jgi:hypothetical protein
VANVVVDSGVICGTAENPLTKVVGVPNVTFPVAWAT